MISMAGNRFGVVIGFIPLVCRFARTSPGLCVVVSALLALGLMGCPLLTIPPAVTTIRLELVADNLTSPLGMAVPKDGTGRLFIVDQVGRIHIIDAGGTLLTTPFLDLSGSLVQLTSDFDERGLLSLAFHPNFATNGRFFVFYTAAKGPGTPADFNAQSRLSEFKVSAADANQADPSSERIILTIDKPQFNHNGGQLAFGPDGFLFVSVGDGGGADDVGLGHTVGLGNGQDKTTILGKLLRIDIDSGDPFGIPADNPFVGQAGVRPEIWAFGLRNPWRFSFDSGGAGRLFLADVGQNLFEEVSIIVKGGNYGWNIREGSHCFDPNNPGVSPAVCPSVGAGDEPLIDPIIEFPHVSAAGRTIGIAVIGGFVYRGQAIPELAGHYVFGDFSTGFLVADGALFAAEEMPSGLWTRRELAVADRPNGRIGRFILGFGQDQQGEMYVLTTMNLGPTGTTGQVHKIVPAN